MPIRTALRPARALSADRRLQELLSRLARGEGGLSIHSVFSHAVNLLTPDGRLVTIASEGLDNAPWTLRGDRSDWTGFHLVPGGSVQVTTSSLLIGGESELLCGWPAAAAWEPVIASADDDVSPHGLQHSLRLLDSCQEWLGRHGVPGGMLASADPDPFEAAVQSRLGKGATALSEALVWYSKSGRLDFFDSAVLGLLGLGGGLTPAGDDHLCGVALVAARPGSRLSGVGDRLLALLDAHPARTTEVSEATLREAARGRARQSLLDLLAGLSAVAPRDGDPLEHVHSLLARVLGIGRTSGTDILSGLLAGLRVERELRGSV